MNTLHQPADEATRVRKHKEFAIMYRPLDFDADEIRVLTLKAGKWDSVIHCKLRCISLKGSIITPYRALSYRWGDANDLFPICLDGILFKVNRNLESALRQLRDEQDDQCLWIDAICINQSSVQERNAQVQKMGLIYHRAAEVVTWLGEASDGSDEAMDLMQGLGDWLVAWIEEAESESEMPQLFGVTPQMMRHRGFDPDGRNWGSLRDLWNRDYWSRVWMIQEIAAANDGMGTAGLLEKGLLVCGKSSLPMEYFALCAKFFRQYLSGSGAVDVGNGQATVEEPLSSMQTMPPPRASTMSLVIQITSTRENASIASLLGATTAFEATDPRDKLFSLIGLATDMVGFVPDYDMKTHRVFEELVKFIIHRTGSLNILLGNRKGNEVDKMASERSWAPEPYGLPRIANTVSASWQHWYTCANATRNLPARITFEDQDQVLRASGLSIGVIGSVIGPFRELNMSGAMDKVTDLRTITDRAGWARPLNELRRLGRSLNSAAADKFWRTLMMNVDQESIKTSRDKDHLSPAPDTLRQQVQKWLDNNTEAQPISPTETGELQRIVDEIMPMMLQFERNVFNRTIFTTESGAMGLGPLNLMPGDMLVVLFGSPMCLALRQFGDQYRIVGDAYTHGFMNGELIEEYENGLMELEHFDII